ncbi:DMT family transporter [Brevibacillus daliensis]|uniref:DMT family transporter n=1 Tax=Brevibacillus daliensis TaxID=2892995 RepID=UPI001E4106F3|nr:multidrug efflux SMR transporter [Brevibacillus daliensis]
MGWIYLVFAGGFEVVGVLGLKKVATKPAPSSIAVLVLGFVFSFNLLYLAMNTLSMGTAYAVWTGIGTMGSALLGMFVYNEPKEWRRILFILMIVTAAIGLKMIS